LNDSCALWKATRFSRLGPYAQRKGRETAVRRSWRRARKIDLPYLEDLDHYHWFRHPPSRTKKQRLQLEAIKGFHRTKSVTSSISGVRRKAQEADGKADETLELPPGRAERWFKGVPGCGSVRLQNRRDKMGRPSR